MINLEDIPIDSTVCLRFRDNPKALLITRWSIEISERYQLAHSLPNTAAKNNIEPVFPNATYVFIEPEEQTPENLQQAYNSEKKGPFRTKAIDHEVFYVFS
jgi:hypothetical protein